MLPTRCPLCGAGMLDCGHEMVRWCEFAGEFEPCALTDVFAAYVDTIEGYLADISEGRRRPIASLRRHLEAEEASGSRDLIIDDALTRLSQLSGVVETEDRQQTRVFWSRDPGAVRESIESWTRSLEIEADTESE